MLARATTVSWDGGCTRLSRFSGFPQKRCFQFSQFLMGIFGLPVSERLGTSQLNRFVTFTPSQRQDVSTLLASTRHQHELETCDSDQICIRQLQTNATNQNSNNLIHLRDIAFSFDLLPNRLYRRGDLQLTNGEHWRPPVSCGPSPSDPLQMPLGFYKNIDSSVLWVTVTSVCE